MPLSVTAVLVTGGKHCDVAVVAGLHLLVEDLRLDIESRGHEGLVPEAQQESSKNPGPGVQGNDRVGETNVGMCVPILSPGRDAHIRDRRAGPNDVGQHVPIEVGQCLPILSQGSDALISDAQSHVLVNRTLDSE